MQRQYIFILLGLLLIGVVAMYMFSPQSVQQQEASEGAIPTHGLVGGTTEAAANLAKQDAKGEATTQATEVVPSGEAPPAPAAELAPLTQGAGDVVDDVPAGAEVSTEATADGQAQPAK